MNDCAVISVSNGDSIKSYTNIEENRELFLVVVFSHCYRFIVTNLYFRL